MKFQYPPENPADAGPAMRSRLYERFPDLLPVVTYGVLLWCASVFLLLNRGGSEMVDQEGLIRSLGAISLKELYEGRWWGLITSAFVHQQMFHVFFNMYWLVRFGTLMERGLGSWKTLAFFLAAALVSSAWQIMASPAGGIGFSGVVYAMGGFMWGAWPRFTGFLEGFNGSTLRWFLIWQIFCFFLSMGNIIPIGNTAHISGMAFGFLVGLWACRGTKRGWGWLAASIFMAASAIVIAIWPLPIFLFIHR
ncbi:rhomboid family intramembrane serine protease [Verrucomicrobiaceae bacterium 5K15]|uniref:Rhomboid family intramembrane serine protease n=1 Tax=Oceaniferula flava TaxID=2800421 RepID=A0AAE2SFT5_9BACT|nr:rhomboid family intramembrane serine protease [Oceaniferula flavus]MBK1856089.1 rhomboid family intramembrane serine protease [Oceaniferula flavus]MBM1137396.1 rhomboid family intramembrane serine protease [Oceaniferula flavus]